MGLEGGDGPPTVVPASEACGMKAEALRRPYCARVCRRGGADGQTVEAPCLARENPSSVCVCVCAFLSAVRAQASEAYGKKVEALSSYTLACEFLGRRGGGVCAVPAGLRYESVSNILRAGGWAGSPAGVVPALQCLRLRVEQAPAPSRLCVVYAMMDNGYGVNV